ncbi:MAG TPA: AraC family transcriptional regulator [Bacteroidales bacterium]|nr:AraC family transcriptional regulator [Bacteroidales bacterium]
MEFIEPILYIGISQTFFAGLLIATKKPISTANRLMAALLFMLFFDLIFALVKIKFIIFYSFPFIAFTYGPLLFLYVRCMTHTRLKFNWLNLLHFIPFIVFFIISVIFRSDKTFTDLAGYFVADRYISVRIVYSVSFFLSISAYSILAFVEIRNHQKHLKDLVSYTSAVITLNWLKIISISFYVTYIIFFILGGLNLIVNFLPFDPYYTIFIFVALFSFIYSFYAVKQPVLVGIIALDDDEPGQKDAESSYRRSGLKGAGAEKLLSKLIDYMETAKPYLDRDLSIQDLSVATGIPRHHITQVLNENYNRNFFMFINEYRVNEVIKRMKSPEYRNYTILAVAYDSGFNSKSTFNSIFKTLTGLTPTQYREKQV